MMHESPIKRRPSRRIYVGDVPIGDGAPIAVQSMTNTETTDVQATLAQIQALADAGAEGEAWRYLEASGEAIPLEDLDFGDFR